MITPTLADTFILLKEFVDMDKPWNYVALGGLGGLIAWGNMSNQQRKRALDFLGDIVVALMQPPP